MIGRVISVGLVERALLAPLEEEPKLLPPREHGLLRVVQHLEPVEEAPPCRRQALGVGENRPGPSSGSWLLPGTTPFREVSPSCACRAVLMGRLGHLLERAGDSIETGTLTTPTEG